MPDVLGAAGPQAVESRDLVLLSYRAVSTSRSRETGPACNEQFGAIYLGQLLWPSDADVFESQSPNSKGVHLIAAVYD